MPLLIDCLDPITQSHELTILCLGRLLPLSESLIETLQEDAPALAELGDEVRSISVSF